MKIREAERDDLAALLELLYIHLNGEDSVPEGDSNVMELWGKILEHPSQHIIVGIEDGIIVSSCVITVIQNLTRGFCPYALIENVVTHGNYRNRGYASEILEYARSIAKEKKCYKIMLMTGSKQESTLRFYEKAGYNMNDKTAFIQWLRDGAEDFIDRIKRLEKPVVLYGVGDGAEKIIEYLDGF